MRRKLIISLTSVAIYARRDGTRNTISKKERDSMFEAKDFKKIDMKYFEIVSKTSYHIIIRSKNTKHYWDIAYVAVTIDRPQIAIFHKHKAEDAFHRQKNFNPRSVEDAQALIKDHDIFHLKREKEKRIKRRNRINARNEKLPLLAK